MKAFQLFTDTENKGVSFTFPNSLTVSIRWGYMNYSDCGDTTAEVAVLSSAGKFVHVPGVEYWGDDILPRMLVRDVADLLHRVGLLTYEEAKDLR